MDNHSNDILIEKREDNTDPPDFKCLSNIGWYNL